ncbi:collagen alpha-1(XXII) chain [Exaiptasia diaphana]|uniref:VWFA domain-containing protein n=1 Tax=Exaiptasia diaphana TaxID=2652724 RepID=A0A913WP64_EXADI|nr:collagen alpha-1(XXII) chain [Exaiptasia diaphana]XP_020891974.1 collagen alpha-1(XXII) chain [Exaiptasia diaphana]KXJ19100.1 Collagen alpha-1(XII) chain [Exaiptasia diaphana]
MYTLTISVILLLSVPCWGGIWERGRRLQKRKNFLDRYQHVPSKVQTARKLMTNFLDRNSNRRLKREIENGIFYDVVFLLDSSSSVGKKEFRNAVLALQTLITRAKDDTVYAGITFATTANVTFTFTNPLDAMKHIGQIKYRPGLTNTQEALEICREELFRKIKSGMRRLSYKRILIVTDGQSNVKKQLTLYKAFKLKNMGIEIFVIAVGGYLRGIAEIVGLASSTDAHLYRVKNMKDLLEIVQLIPPWDLIRQQQKTWLENMFEDVDDSLKYQKIQL